MICSKKLFKTARKWNILSAVRRKRISILLLGNEAHKGHFVVYTADQKRFLIPLVYLNKVIFRRLLKLAEEEFGLQIDGPITLPCDASFMEYVVLLIERGAAKDLEQASLIMSVNTSCCSSLSRFHEEQTKQHQLLVCG